ncbi:TPA: sigma-54-dependent Fis family transcriptional regulator [bacterium]|nr:sigma-54-dependent Fis family transcriptional regulator [bacterium]
MSTILLVDDEKNILKSISLELKSEGYNVITAQNGFDALQAIASNNIDLVMMDVIMPGMDGIETLRKIKDLQPSLPVIMMSSQGTIGMAVNATKLGAYDFIEKGKEGWDIEPVLVKIRNGLAFSKLQSENTELREKLDEKYNIIGSSLAMQELHAQIKKAGPSDGRVLIFGENGTGKELVAHAIHQNSPRRNKSFIKVNCAAIPEELIESELFGHEKGSFTGAVNQLIGKFELADEGTIFLDEIGDMSQKTQAKVLRVLQEGEFERVGSQKTIKVDVRVIAATNKDLQEEIIAGNFREDLYYRLNVIPIHVPSLRSHKEDIPELVAYFMKKYCEEHGKKPKKFSSSAMDILINHSWHGNVRQLKNVVERMMIMINNDDIVDIDVVWALGLKQDKLEKLKSEQEIGLKDIVDKSERGIIISTLESCDWNVSQAAQKLNLERSHLYKKMNKYGIKRPPNKN